MIDVKFYKDNHISRWADQDNLINVQPISIGVHQRSILGPILFIY